MNAAKRITAQDYKYKKKIIMWMKAHLYSVQAKSQTGKESKIQWQHKTAKAARYSVGILKM